MTRRFAAFVVPFLVIAVAGCRLAASTDEVAPAWIDVHAQNANKRATEALELIQTAPAHGLEGDYGAPQIVALHQRIDTLKRGSAERADALAEFDARVTGTLLAFAHDVAIGHSTPQALDRRWKTRRTAPDLPATLAAANGPLANWLDSIRPPHPEYVALQQALADVEGQKLKGGWPRVNAGDEAALRQRLTTSGQLKEGVSVPEAIGAFQNLHGIKATGILDAATLAVMNVSLDDRLAQIRTNLERWRWMPDDLGAQHVIVNIPYFHLVAVENGRPVKDIRVVVGKIGHETPIFSDEMESVVFSPYWNIPDGIAEGETVPAIGKDPDYLRRNNIDILRVSDRSAEPMAASDVDWADPQALRGLALRQRPGSTNALGLVKFLFPNPFDVYLHDTPADRLFTRQSRAFSHGCMRVEEPEALAEYVLKNDPDWTPERISRAMHAGVERHVKLKQKIPVHVVYFTAWVDDGGGLHYRPDIYGFDKRQK